jgi:iron complex outermembrane receptor protein
VPPFSQPLEGAVLNNGENVLARYRHVTDEDSDWTLQVYYDNFERDSTILNTERAKTFDVDFQYRFRLSDRQMVTCGAGYRYIHMDCPSQEPFTESIVPVEQSYNKVSQFVQDEIALAPDTFSLILGCKLEENSYTGFEYQPTARLLWTPDRTHTVWGAVSRAVRTPCEVSRSLSNTVYLGPNMPFLRVLGNEDYGSETLMAYELGYRTQATERFSWDIATFYNVYNNLEEVLPVSGPQPEPVPLPPHLILPMTFTNLGNADSYGVELATNWTVSERWRLSTGYTFLRLFMHDGVGGPTTNGNSPSHQVSLRSSWNLRENLDFDLTARYVDCLTDLDVPSYITMDLRLAWRPRKHLELAVVGQNLLQAHHYEFGRTTGNLDCEVTEVPRGVYGMATWRY